MSESPTALVTGANSGLGFEAAAQLAENGYGSVIITARDEAKAVGAVAELEARTGRDVFTYVTLDNSRLDTIDAASEELERRGASIDILLLNAGIAPTKQLRRTADGIELTTAASLIGHHLLTMRLLEKRLLTAHARIVIAGSEAARGDVPTFKPVDLDELAAQGFGGDISQAVEAQVRMTPPAQYNPSDTYATTKLFAAWWAAELAPLLPAGMAVNAVSPGSTPDTNAAREAPFYMRKIMLPLFKLLPGMSHSVADGARRYLDVASYDSATTGEFFASKPKKMTGPIEAIDMPHFYNPAAQRALWEVTVKAAGGVGYPSVT